MEISLVASFTLENMFKIISMLKFTNQKTKTKVINYISTRAKLIHINKMTNILPDMYGSLDEGIISNF